MTGRHRFKTPSERNDFVAKAAVAAGAVGVVSTVPFSPPVQALLLVVFMLTGPGSAAMCWSALPPAVTVAAIIGLSVATVLAIAIVMAWVPFWGPIPSCLMLSTVCILSGFVRLRALRKLESESAMPW